MADGSMHSLAMIAESNYGTTPSNPTFVPIRHTSCSLGLSKDAIQSEEIRSDRQITDLRHGSRQIGGDIGIELSYGSFDTALEALLGGTWVRKATITASTISAIAVDNSYNDSGGGFVAAGFETGDRIVVTGFTGNVINNITSGVLTNVTDAKLTLAGTDGDVIVDDAADESVTIQTFAYKVKSGTTRRSFTIERKFADFVESAKPYHRFTGCEFDKLSLTVNANAMIKGTLSVMGQDLTLGGTALSGSSYSAASTTSPFASFTGTLEEGGGAIAIVTEVQLNVENGFAPKFVVGSQTTLEPSWGRSNISGTMTAYFEDAVMLEKFINETESSILFELSDGAGNYLEFNLPRVKYSGGQPDVSGEGPITLAMPFQALYSSTSAANIIVTRKPAP